MTLPLLVTLLLPEFMRPGRLWWLLLIPALLVLYVVLVRRGRGFSRRRASSPLDFVVPHDRSWKRHVAVGAAVLSLAALNVAYAQPRDYAAVPRERATVVVVLDVSRSMEAEDVKPNRMRAAQDAAKQFLTLLPPRFNVALVSFAATAQIVVPPTTDRGMVSRAIDGLTVAPSTAIGESIYTSLDALKLAPPDPKDPNAKVPAAIVLLSDGATNIGRSSLTAAQESKKQGVPIYTIAYGTTDGYVVEGGRRNPVPVNHGELRSVARESGGQKLSAASSSELEDAYKDISQAIGSEKVEVEVTERYVKYALVFAVLASLSLISLAARWP